MDYGKTLRVALFGCGRMGLHHARVIQSQGCATFLGVYDPFVDEGELGSLIFRGVEVSCNPEYLLKKTKADVVHVCTPPHTHADLAKLALNHGAHVYVEKPFALEVTEAEQIIGLAGKLGLKVCAGHQLLFENQAQRAQCLLREIGQIVHVESYFSFRQVKRSLSSIEQVIDILPHPVYLLLHFLHAGQREREERKLELRSVDAKPNGDVHAIVRCADASGVLVVTLRGRPVESYLRIVGTNGWLYVDFVRNTVVKISGPGSSPIGIVLNPYNQAKQLIMGNTKAFALRAIRRQRSYPGLFELIGAFYDSILNGTPPPLTANSILETVRICEAIGRRLREVEVESDRVARFEFEQRERQVPSPDPKKGPVLVTGGTGLLGRAIASELRSHGWRVRVVARHLPGFSARVPGVDYAVADLSEAISPEILTGMATVVHCAAETAGGKEAHERNTVRATRNILESARKAGVKKFIHISSLAVLKPGREVGNPIDENTPIDLENLDRGPYVWGKARSEQLVKELEKDLDLEVRIIRPGPLVDFGDLQPPGRLGREIAPFFVAVGSPRSKLSICKVGTAAEVIRSYLEDWKSAPPVLNLVEPDAPTRGELVSYFLKNRPDLKPLWVPAIALRLISPIAKVTQRFLFPGKNPKDIYTAFSSENYRTDLVKIVIQKTQQFSNPSSTIRPESNGSIGK